MAGPSPPPPGWGPAPPSGPPPPGWPPPPAQWSPPPSYATAPGPRTDPFAIVSLVASLAGLFFCLVGQIVGIVFGHIARSRVKRTGEGGAGLALAGLIIGYAEIAVMAIVVVVIVIVAAHNGDHGSDSAALRLADNIAYAADGHSSTPRDADVVRLAIREAGFADNTVYVGSTGVEAVLATDAELADEDWRLEVHSGIFGEACLWLPPTSNGNPRIVSGECHQI